MTDPVFRTSLTAAQPILAAQPSDAQPLAAAPPTAEAQPTTAAGSLALPSLEQELANLAEGLRGVEEREGHVGALLHELGDAARDVRRLEHELSALTSRLQRALEIARLLAEEAEALRRRQRVVPFANAPAVLARERRLAGESRTLRLVSPSEPPSADAGGQSRLLEAERRLSEARGEAGRQSGALAREQVARQDVEQELAAERERRQAAERAALDTGRELARLRATPASQVAHVAEGEGAGPTTVIAPAGEAAPADESQVPEPTPAAQLAPQAEPTALAEPTLAWLPLALTALALEDAPAAARLFLQLLIAQGLVAQRPMTFDLELAGVGIFGVGIDTGEATTWPLDRFRRRRAVDFRLRTDAAGAAALLAGAKLRRFRRAGRPAVSGRHRRWATGLAELTRGELGLAALGRAGVWLDPGLVYRALAHRIDPGWMRSESFWIEHRIEGRRGGTWWLGVERGAHLVVTQQAPTSAPAALIESQAHGFLALLGGAALTGAEKPSVRGDRAALDALRRWTLLAQAPPTQG